MDTEALESLADQVSDILAERQAEQTDSAFATVGKALLTAGVVYVGIRATQAAFYRRKLRKLERKEKIKVVEAK